ncbi:MAG: hypothetical protein AB7O97_05195 [Planctomycetota bacterium]
MRPARAPRAALASFAILMLGAAGCSTFTSIDREDDGKYVLTGYGGSQGFVWICSYDPATRTLTVHSVEPR